MSRRLLAHSFRREASRARCRAGTSRQMRMPIMASTSNASTHVKPSRWRRTVSPEVILDSSIEWQQNDCFVEAMSGGYRFEGFLIAPHLPFVVEGFVLFADRAFERLRAEGSAVFLHAF